MNFERSQFGWGKFLKSLSKSSTMEDSTTVVQNTRFRSFQTERQLNIPKDSLDPHISSPYFVSILKFLTSGTGLMTYLVGYLSSNLEAFGSASTIENSHGSSCL